jgi:hypothetical protein
MDWWRHDCQTRHFQQFWPTRLLAPFVTCRIGITCCQKVWPPTPAWKLTSMETGNWNQWLFILLEARS